MHLCLSDRLGVQVQRIAHEDCINNVEQNAAEEQEDHKRHHKAQRPEDCSLL